MATQDLLTNATADGAGTLIGPLAGQSTVEITADSVYDGAEVLIETGLTNTVSELWAKARFWIGAKDKAVTTSYQGANYIRAVVRNAGASTDLTVRVTEP